MTIKTLTEENSKFSMDVQPEFKFAMDSQGNPTKQRMFSGVAYSGGMIENHWYWGQLVFDLSTMSLPTKLPALIDHDRGKRAGYTTTFNKDNATGLTVAGNLLTNDSGSAVAKDSDEGFPWQMSVHISPNSVEEVAQGQAIEVNGRQFVGPVTVFRNSTIEEVSFTATGWDSNTSATALSKANKANEFSQKEQEAMDLTQALAEIATLTAAKQALETENTELKSQFSKIKADKRTADIKELFASTGTEFKEDDADVMAFSKMDEDSFVFSAKKLKEQFGKSKKLEDNKALFSHQAESGVDTSVQASKESPLVADAKSRAGVK